MKARMAIKTQHTFRFLDDDLNRKAIRLIEMARIPFTTDDDGAIHYAAADEKRIENDLFRSVRDCAFSSWIIVSCPGDWTERYREYMRAHDVPYREELRDGEVNFLIPGNYRPHLWKIAY